MRGTKTKEERQREERTQVEEEIELVEAEEVVQTTSREARIQRGLGHVLPTQFHHFVTGEEGTCEVESELITVEIDTDAEKIAALRVPLPPVQQAHPQVAGQVAPSQPMSLAASGGIKGRFGHLFYKGDDGLGFGRT